MKINIVISFQQEGLATFNKLNQSQVSPRNKKILGLTWNIFSVSNKLQRE